MRGFLFLIDASIRVCRIRGWLSNMQDSHVYFAQLAGLRVVETQITSLCAIIVPAKPQQTVFWASVVRGRLCSKGALSNARIEKSRHVHQRVPAKCVW